MSNPGIEVGDSVCDRAKVPPDQCTQALKETDRFTRPIPFRVRVRFVRVRVRVRIEHWSIH